MYLKEETGHPIKAHYQHYMTVEKVEEKGEEEEANNDNRQMTDTEKKLCNIITYNDKTPVECSKPEEYTAKDSEKEVSLTLIFLKRLRTDNKNDKFADYRVYDCFV